MKTKQSITAATAFAALVIAWGMRVWHQACAQTVRIEAKFDEDAIGCFEGEGGLVLS